jgi:hypothetical protein
LPQWRASTPASEAGPSGVHDAPALPTPPGLSGLSGLPPPAKTWYFPPCVVCEDDERTVMFRPCLHFVACETCFVKIATTTKLCCICRAPIEGWERPLVS